MIDTQRYPRLARIDTPADLRKFEERELPEVARELREYLIESVLYPSRIIKTGWEVEVIETKVEEKPKKEKKKPKPEAKGGEEGQKA